MSEVIDAFSQEQLRTLVNLDQRYRGWMAAERILAELPYDMRRKEVGPYSYLYILTDRRGSGTSAGRWGPEAEARLSAFKADREDARVRSALGGDAVAESVRLYRALRLPVLANEVGAILREADRRRLLGSHLLLVGTNAMLAYALEAGGMLRDAPLETEDCDLAWTSREPEADERPIWDMLKAVDPTFTLNTERPFQARNARQYEVELLVAPSRAATLGRRDQPRPFPIPEQEWLLFGRPVDRIIACADSSPARLVVPDPRWFALLKLWIAEKPERNAYKRPKDRAQGLILLDAVREAMPHYPLDAAFEAELPDILMPTYERWRERPVPPRPARHW